MFQSNYAKVRHRGFPNQARMGFACLAATVCHIVRQNKRGTQSVPRPPQRRVGLTLLELVVALGVLAALTTIALQSLEPIQDQTRYETTQRLLEDIRHATSGAAVAWSNNGTPLVTGYIADTGSLPTSLGDLVSKPAGLGAYAQQTFDSDRDATDDVAISSGWNGPYLHLGVGQQDVVDGWGRALLVDPDGGTFDFRSQGSDGDSVGAETGYEADLIAALPSASYTTNSVVFRLFAIDATTGTRIDPTVTGTEQLGIVFYSINGNGGTTGAIEEVTLPIAASGTFEATRTDVMHGRAAARAFLWDDVDGNDQLDAGETITASSHTHYFVLLGGVDARIELELR